MWWGIKKGDGNADVKGESEYHHTGTRRTMRIQALKKPGIFLQAASGEKATRESTKTVDGEKVKETAGTDRAVIKLLYHHLVSVLTQERAFLAQSI